MSDIFLSYAGKDRERAGAVAASLAKHGWTVFWDRTIPAGKTWRQVIGAALGDARCVVVLWSGSSIISDWVHEEADEGRERNILIPVLIEDVRPPIGFRSMQSADLAHWDGSDGFPAYRRLISDIEGLLGPSPLEAKQRAEQVADRKRAEDTARRSAEEEAGRREADKEARQKAEQEKAEAKRKAEEQAEAQRKAEAEKLEHERSAAPARARQSKARWIPIVAAAVVVLVGGGLAVYHYWKPVPPEPPRVVVKAQDAVEETASVPAEPRIEEPKVEPLDAEMVAQTNTNVREGPGMEHEKVTTLSRGTTVAVTGHVEDWFRVALGNGQEGYVFKELLSKSNPAPATTAASNASKTLEPGDTFQDCGVCPEMVVVPAGSFLMGSPIDEPERSDDEGRQHRVTIAKPFAVGVYEVTFAEWEACVNGGGCNGYRPDDENWGGDRRPVINVSWHDAQAYVQWLSRKTGKSYHLLTEAEWEYAARAGTTTPFHFGSTISPDQANYDGNYTYNGGTRGAYLGKTMPVGSFQANGFGLSDVHGNVWEWVADCYDEDAYQSHKSYPAMVGGWQDSCLRVVRGGSWDIVPMGLRSANRVWDGPGSRDDIVGFRVARTLFN